MIKKIVNTAGLVALVAITISQSACSLKDNYSGNGVAQVPGDTTVQNYAVISMGDVLPMAGALTELPQATIKANGNFKNDYATLKNAFSSTGSITDGAYKPAALMNYFNVIYDVAKIAITNDAKAEAATPPGTVVLAQNLNLNVAPAAAFTTAAIDSFVTTVTERAWHVPATAAQLAIFATYIQQAMAGATTQNATATQNIAIGVVMLATASPEYFMRSNPNPASQSH